ncbi:MAG: hypothetical protein ABW221_22180 [Vicinamibacteria bacterium]
MKPAAALFASALLFVARPGVAAVEVRVAGQSVDIQATNAPITEVLDRLSRQTQMKVVYEGAPPRQTISLDLRGRTPVEAVEAALEGQGVNYAMSMDDTGTRVQTLLVTGTATASPAGRAAGPAPNFPDRHAAREMQAEAVIEEPEPVPEDDGAPPPDTSVGLNGANPQTLGAQKDAPEAVAPQPAEGGSNWTASPFAPSAPPVVQKTDPAPQATPPPFNP